MGLFGQNVVPLGKSKRLAQCVVSGVPPMHSAQKVEHGNLGGADNIAEPQRITPMRRKGFHGVVLATIIIVAMLSISGAASANVTSRGGPVQLKPHIYAIFWGNNWNTQSAAIAERAKLETMYRDISNSAWQGILTQYWQPEGSTFRFISPEVAFSSYVDSTVTAPTEVNNAKMVAEISAAIKANGGWPAQPTINDQFVLFPAPGSTFASNMNTTACGFHYYSGTSTIYAFVGWGGVENGNPFERCNMTYVAAHEYAEAATDPLVTNGWREWITAGNNEIADLCQPEEAINLVPGISVPQLWDRYDGNGEGCSPAHSNPPQLAPEILTGAPANVTMSKATLQGTVKLNGLDVENYWFEWGTSTSYDHKGSSQPGGNLAVGASQAITGLERNTTYHYRLVIKDAGVQAGNDREFKTLDGQPTVRARDATAIGANSATLNASVNPEGSETKYFFEYGESSAYGNRVPVSEKSVGAGINDVSVSEIASGLVPESVYHYRVVAINSKSTTYGEDRSFKTQQRFPSFLFSFGTAGFGVGKFREIEGIAVSSKGTLYVAQPNSAVEEFGSNGEFLGVLNGAGGSGPSSLAIDSKGNLWVASGGLSLITEFNPNGERIRSFGEFGEGNGQLWAPKGVAIDSKGNVWVVDFGNNRVQEFTSEGKYLRQIRGQSLGSGKFDFPYSIAIDSQDNVWVGDLSGRVVEFDSQGNYLNRIGEGRFNSSVGGIVFDAKGNLWVVSPNGNCVMLFTAAGEYLGQFGGVEEGEGPMIGPAGIARDAKGDLWVTSYGTTKVEKWGVPVPQAVTGAATAVKATSATLNATINPEGLSTSYYFEYGPTVAYGSKVPMLPKQIGSAAGSVQVADSITGLVQGSTYHFRVVAQSEGGVSRGTDRTLSTPKLPVASTGAATAVKATSATLNATINPEGLSTSYYFDYGPTVAYGSKVPIPVKVAGSGTSTVLVSETPTDLLANTTYHYRIVATSNAGVFSGEDKVLTTEGAISGQLAGMAITDPFNGSTTPVSNFGTNWFALGWAGSGTPKGEVRSDGWGPRAVYPAANGAYYATSITDAGSEVAAVATMAANPSLAGRYFSVWLDMQSPSGVRSGYELRFTNVSSGIYEVMLSKWSGGNQTVLATRANYVFADGNSLALVDQGSTVSAWTNTGAGFSYLLSGSDTAFGGGKAGVEGSGNITRLTNFRIGLLLIPSTSMDAALKALPVRDAFATAESPLSAGGAWAALFWDNGSSGHNTGQVSGGWGPFDAFEAINGAFWQKATFADTGAGNAVASSLVARPANTNRYFSLWLDMPNPASARTGYELRFTETSTGIYDVVLSRWQAGAKTVLASKSGYSLPIKSKFALVDKAGIVSAWTNTASEYTQLLFVSDSAFTSGNAGVEGSGNITRLTEFRSGPLSPF